MRQLPQGPHQIGAPTNLTKNAVKHTYSRLGFQNFSGGNTPGPPAYKGRGGKGEGRGGREGPPQQCLPQGPHQPKSGPGVDIGDAVCF